MITLANQSSERQAKSDTLIAGVELLNGITEYQRLKDEKDAALIVRDYLKDHGKELIDALISAAKVREDKRQERAVDFVKDFAKQFSDFVTEVAMEEIHTTEV